jgi:hypothetical protein
MLLRTYDLIHCGPEQACRVLWIAPNGEQTALLDMAPGSWPVLTPLERVMEELRQGNWTLDAGAFVGDFRLEHDIQESERRRRDQAWNSIKGIVTREPEVYVRLARARMISDAVAAGSATRPTIESRLRAYWLNGMAKNALLPAFHKCGAPGVVREPGEVKRGRPRDDGKSGVNVDAGIRKIFGIGVLRYKMTGSSFTLKDAYIKMVGDFFADSIVDSETGKLEFTPKDHYKQTGYPTFEQFRYAVLRDQGTRGLLRPRMAPRDYDRTYRGLTDTSAAHTWGPGARYQIDATLLDVYLVSRLNRRKIVGRPVLYLVVDVFSRMIVGMYVGIENASWVVAMMALANTVASKPEYCARFGVTIEHADWPAQTLPAILLGDRGEIESTKIDHLENMFNVVVENAAAYEPSWKAVVEKRFHLLPAKFRPYVPGYVRCDYKPRTGGDYRLDALLDIDEITAILIELVLYHNNHHELRGYDREPGMTADRVPSIPIHLHNWGIASRSGAPRSFAPEQVRFALLPVEKDVSVTAQGVRFRGRMYSSPYAVQRHWFERARRDGVWRVNMSYDPRVADVIYVHVPEEPGYVVFEVTSRGRDGKAASLWEVEAQQEDNKQLSAEHRVDQEMALAGTLHTVERRVEDALARAPAPTASNAERVRGIRGNRREVRAETRAAEGDAFRPSPPPSRPPANSEGQHPACADHDDVDVGVRDLMRMRRKRIGSGTAE